jgi:hypothetical protein
MPKADSGNCFHLRVRGVAAKVRGDDRIISQHFGHERVGAAAKCWGEYCASGVNNVDITLTLVSAKLIDLLFKVRIVHGKQMSGQIQSLPARIVAIKPALEVAGNRC